MSTAHRIEHYSFDDFCELVKDGQKGDLIDGVIYMASPENTDANDIVGWLYTLLRLFAKRRDLGRVFFSRVAFQLDDTNGPEPDVAFVAKMNLERVRRGRVTGPPDLAVEVVSPDSVERDYRQKRQQYERAGVLEYWIVDELEEKVTFLRLDRKGKYRVVRLESGRFRSVVLPGFWIRPEWFWLKSQPDALDALNEILDSN